MGLHALFVGCDYPGESFALPDCEIDAERDALRFAPYVASSTVLLSKQAPRTKAIKALQAFLAKCKSGDVALLSFSGHGTRERKGKKYTEAIVMNDGGLIYEDELRAIINDRPSRVIAGIKLDCCHAGGLPRSANGRKIIRSVPVGLVKTHDFTPPSRPVQQPNFVYLPCLATQYSYSTGVGGAYSITFDDSFNEVAGNTTLRSLHKKIRKRLPSDQWPQTPQFFCRDKKLATRTIKSFQAK